MSRFVRGTTKSMISRRGITSLIVQTSSSFSYISKMKQLQKSSNLFVGGVFTPPFFYGFEKRNQQIT